MPGQAERPTLDYAIVCDDVRFEVGDKISLMGVFDAINVQSFPTVHPRLSVVAAWAGLRGEAISEIELVDPSGSLIGRLGVAISRRQLKKRELVTLQSHITCLFKLRAFMRSKSI